MCSSQNTIQSNSFWHNAYVSKSNRQKSKQAQKHSIDYYQSHTTIPLEISLMNLFLHSCAVDSYRFAWSSRSLCACVYFCELVSNLCDQSFNWTNINLRQFACWTNKHLFLMLWIFFRKRNSMLSALLWCAHLITNIAVHNWNSRVVIKCLIKFL